MYTALILLIICLVWLNERRLRRLYEQTAKDRNDSGG